MRRQGLRSLAQQGWTAQIDKMKQLLKPREVLERFSISRASLKALVRSGHLDPVKVNSKVYRYKASQIDALADKLECQFSGLNRMPNNISPGELDALSELHDSRLPMPSRMLVGFLILAGEGRISFTRALDDIYEALIWQVLAHPSKTIKAIHAAHEAALAEEMLTDAEINTIANRGDTCLGQ